MKPRPASMVPAALLCMLVAGCQSSSTPKAAAGGTSPAAAVATSAAANNSSAVSTAATPSSAARTTGSAAATTAAAVHGAGKSHPCSLVTSAEAQAALGVAATIQHENVDDGIYTTCEYASADTQHYLTIQVFDDSVNKSDFARNPDGSTPVAGVGGGAYWAPDQQLLAVWQNQVQITFQLSDNTNTMSVAQIEAAVVTVAKTAVTRL